MKTDIIWDIDGVLSDFTLGFKKFINERHRIPVAPCGAKKSWAFRGLAPAEEVDMWQQAASGKYDWSQQGSLLTAGDWQGIRDLKEGGATYWYITSRFGPPSQVIAQTQQWLSDQGFPDVENLCLTMDKVDSIKFHPAHIDPIALIDDDIRNIVSYDAAFGAGRVFIRDWQYNRGHAVFADYGHSIESVTALSCNRVSSVSEFCYKALENIDGIDRG
jgi:hypothetical protein